MQLEDALIVGAGPIGLACAISAKRRGLDPLVIDAGAVVNSVVHYPVGMGFFTTPELLEIGDHPFVCAAEKPTREEALKYYRGVVRSEGIRISTYTKLIGVSREQDRLRCVVEMDVLRSHAARPRDRAASRLDQQEILARRLVLATGYYDHPNRLDVPGEDLPHVSHYFDEAHMSCGLDVVVIGGKNSAVEAALLLFRAGARTTLVYRGTSFGASVKYWLRPDIENRIRAGEIAARLGAQVVRIDDRHVVIGGAEGVEESLRADRVYALIGFRPDVDLFRRIGISVDDHTGVPTHDPKTLESNVPGVHLAGSITAGYATSNIFIENGRFDGDRIFGTQLT